MPQLRQVGGLERTLYELRYRLTDGRIFELSFNADEATADKATLDGLQFYSRLYADVVPTHGAKRTDSVNQVVHLWMSQVGYPLEPYCELARTLYPELVLELLKQELSTITPRQSVFSTGRIYRRAYDLKLLERLHGAEPGMIRFALQQTLERNIASSPQAQKWVQYATAVAATALRRGSSPNVGAEALKRPVTPLSPEMIDSLANRFFRERGISPETEHDFRLRRATDGRLEIPLRDPDGVELGVATRALLDSANCCVCQVTVTSQEWARRQAEGRAWEELLKGSLENLLLRSLSLTRFLVEHCAVDKLIPAEDDAYTCRCPFHSDDEVSMRISQSASRPGTQRFHCYGCGVSGDLLDAVRLRDPRHIPDRTVAADTLEGLYQLRAELQDQLDRTRHCPHCNAATSGLDTLDNQFPRFSYRQSFQKNTFLYNADQAAAALAEPDCLGLYLGEGYSDSWALHEAGCKAACAFNAAKPTETQLKIALELLAGTGKPLILVPDADAVGLHACFETIDKLRELAPEQEVLVLDFGRTALRAEGKVDLSALLSQIGKARLFLFLDDKTNYVDALSWQVREMILTSKLSVSELERQIGQKLEQVTVESDRDALTAALRLLWPNTSDKQICQFLDAHLAGAPSLERDLAAWAAEYGSKDLRYAFERGYEMGQLAVVERAKFELGRAAEVDFSGERRPRKRNHPSIEALRAERTLLEERAWMAEIKPDQVRIVWDDGREWLQAERYLGRYSVYLPIE